MLGAEPILESLEPRGELGQLHRGYLPDILTVDIVVEGFPIQTPSRAFGADLSTGELSHPLLCILACILFICLSHEIGAYPVVGEGDTTEAREALILDH